MTYKNFKFSAMFVSPRDTNMAPPCTKLKNMGKVFLGISHLGKIAWTDYPRPRELCTELLHCFGGNFPGSVHFLLHRKILRPEARCGACMFYKKRILGNVHKIYICSTLKVCACWMNAPGTSHILACFHWLHHFMDWQKDWQGWWLGYRWMCSPTIRQMNVIGT